MKTDYNKLAEELMLKMQLFHKGKRQKSIDDLIQGEAFVLYHIRHKEAGIVPGEISDAMGITSARVAAALNSLEGKGFITREIDTGDRRRIIVKVTPKGREAEEGQEKFYLNMTANMLKALGDADARDYVRIMGKLAEIMTAEK